MQRHTLLTLKTKKLPVYWFQKSLTFFITLVLFCCSPSCQKSDKEKAFQNQASDVYWSNKKSVFLPPQKKVLDYGKFPQRQLSNADTANEPLKWSPAKNPTVTTVTEPTPKLINWVKISSKPNAPIVKKALPPKITTAGTAIGKDLNPLSITSYNTLQGLCHSYVRCMIQDSKGALWIGTAGGLSRFDGRLFSTFTEKEGLINNSVWSLQEDKKGNILIATDGGFCIYDGLNFYCYSEENGLQSKQTKVVKQDKKGRIWVGGAVSGLTLFTEKEIKTLSTKEGLSNDSISAIHEDGSGSIWVGTSGGGLMKISNNDISVYNRETGMPSRYISDIKSDGGTGLWISSYASGLIHFHDTIFEHYTKDEGLASNRVKCTTFGPDGTLWIGTYGNGLSLFNGLEFMTINQASSGLYNFLPVILQDKDGKMWLGADGGGIVKFNGDNFRHYNEQNGLPGNYVFSIAKDLEDCIWFGTFGNGLCKWNGKKFFHIGEKQGFTHQIIKSLSPGKDSSMWVGTMNGVVKLKNNQSLHVSESHGLFNDFITCTQVDSRGNLWIGAKGAGLSLLELNEKDTGEALLSVFNEKHGLQSMQICELAIDAFDNLWIGSEDNGIAVINLSSFYNKKRVEISYLTQKTGLKSGGINCIEPEVNGSVWIGTKSDGAALVKNFKIHYLNEKNELPSNNVTDIKISKNNDVYFMTFKGIAVLEKANQGYWLEPHSKNQRVLKSYFYDDGFIGIACTRNASYLGDSSLWIGTDDRLTNYKINRGLRKKNKESPTIELVGVDLFNETIDWSNINDSIKKRSSFEFELKNGIVIKDLIFSGLAPWLLIPKELRLSHQNNFVRFRFSTPKLHQQEQILYSVFLKGLDKTWGSPSKENVAIYGNLEPGSYTFLVKALMPDGQWTQPTSYEFEIVPPWYFTTWFKICLFILVVGSAFFIIRRREYLLKKKARQLKEMVEVKTRELKTEKENTDQKNKEILESISYAKRIQDAYMPPERILYRYLPESFLIFVPRDLVSGDFYWFYAPPDAEGKRGKTIYVGVADCTGHGVPGAIMSVICCNALNEVIVSNKINNTGLILEETRRIIIQNLKSEVNPDFEEELLSSGLKRASPKDGMDISLVFLDTETGQLEYSGANNPAWILRKDESKIEELKPDKQPVGYHESMTPFTTHKSQLRPGDYIFLFSDGIHDQFGGEKNKKLTRKKFRQLLEQSHADNPSHFKNKIEEFFHHYKGQNEQIDDICFLGIRQPK